MLLLFATARKYFRNECLHFSATVSKLLEAIRNLLLIVICGRATTVNNGFQLTTSKNHQLLKLLINFFKLKVIASKF